MVPCGVDIGLLVWTVDSVGFICISVYHSLSEINDVFEDISYKEN